VSRVQRALLRRASPTLNRDEQRLVRVIERPARDFVMAREPDIRKLFHITQQIVQHRRHQRPAAEVRVHGQIDQRWRFIIVEIVEGVFVDVVKVTRAGTQGAVVGKIAVGDSDELAALGFKDVRQVRVVVIAVPKKSASRRGIPRYAASARRRD